MTARLLTVVCLASACAQAQSWLQAPREAVTTTGDDIRAFADFDGDGRLDLLVTRPRANVSGIDRMYVLLGRSGGDWVPGPTIPVFPRGYQADEYALAGDLTGDGLPDVVTSLRELSGEPGSGFLLYRNRGGGSFAEPVHTPTGVPAVGVEGVLSDWDGDGVLELVSAHFTVGPGVLQRWSWRGGAFVGSNALPLPGYAEHLAVGELTGDGMPDVVVGESGSTRVHIVPTSAGGGLGPVQTVAVGAPSPPWGRVPACGDVDGDGDDDVVVGWPTGIFTSAIAVLDHDGAGGLTVGATQALSVHPGGYWQGRPHVVDWDGDGDGDVLLSWETLQLVENRGAAGMQPAAAVRVAGPGSPGGVRDGNEGVGSADFDGDGRIDFATGRVVVHGTGRFEATYFGDIFSTVQQPLDWDRDGDVDVLESGGTLRVNHGRLQFGRQDLFPAATPPFFYVEAYALGDLTGDGCPDLLVTYFQRTSPRTAALVGMHRLEGTPHGQLVDRGLAGQPGVTIGDSATFPVVQRDLDGDGDVDIAVVDGWWENDGGGGFTSFHAVWAGRPATVADVDGNGFADVLTSETTASATIHRIERNQAGGFASETLATVPAVPAPPPRLADLDGDGDLDFAVGSPAGPVVILRENRGGTFAPPRTLASRGSAFETLLVDDFDGDGALDLAGLPGPGANSFGASALLWRRTGPGLGYAPPRAYLAPASTFGEADLDGDGDPDAYGRYGVLGSGRWSGAWAGSFHQYGSSEPGPSGIAPVLGLRGPARAGRIVELRLSRGEGGAPAWLLLGLGPAALPTPAPGLTLRVDPVTAFLGVSLQGPAAVPGAGWLHLPIRVPSPIAGFELFHQVLSLDGGGAAASNGLEIAYGR